MFNNNKYKNNFKDIKKLVQERKYDEIYQKYGSSIYLRYVTKTHKN